MKVQRVKNDLSREFNLCFVSDRVPFCFPPNAGQRRCTFLIMLWSWLLYKHIARMTSQKFHEYPLGGHSES